MPDQEGDETIVTGQDWSPIRQISTNGGMRFGLDDDEFRRWWHAVPFEDQQSFKVHGGRDGHARFACVLDWYLSKRGGRPSSGAIIEAYATAFALDPYEVATQQRATKAWDHPAIQDFISRLQYRGRAQAGNRVMLKYTALLENMLGEAMAEDSEVSLEEKVKIANASVRFLGLTMREDLFEKGLRSKKSFARALDAIENESDFDKPSDNDFQRFIGQLMRQFGSDKVQAMVDEQKALQPPRVDDPEEQ